MKYCRDAARELVFRSELLSFFFGLARPVSIEVRLSMSANDNKRSQPLQVCSLHISANRT